MVKRCYICGAEGTTREHVPPLAFFPRGFRRDLWTVPACEEHNIGNSKDVEYVRNLVVSHGNCKGTARQLAQGAVLRSFERSEALFFETFQREKAAVNDGQEAAGIRLNLPRFEIVMKAIARGVLFREIGRISDDWDVLMPNSLSREKLEGVSNNRADFANFIGSLPFTSVATPEPTVFRYGRNVFDNRLDIVYLFEFYEGFHAYAWKARSETFQL